MSHKTVKQKHQKQHDKSFKKTQASTKKSAELQIKNAYTSHKQVFKTSHLIFPTYPKPSQLKPTNLQTPQQNT